LCRVQLTRLLLPRLLQHAVVLLEHTGDFLLRAPQLRSIPHDLLLLLLDLELNRLQFLLRDLMAHH
jgi:hypothetical protein